MCVCVCVCVCVCAGVLPWVQKVAAFVTCHKIVLSLFQTVQQIDVRIRAKQRGIVHFTA